jgi:6-phosphofructokinase 1
MTTENSMNDKPRRIAINMGGGFVPGMNAVVMGVTMAAAELGWEVVGIRNGFAGLLEPGDFPDGGLVPLPLPSVEFMDPAASGVLGQSAWVNPFHMRHVDDDGMVEEVDRSDELLAALQEQGIDALVSAVGGRGLSVLYKLHRKGLNVVCVPRSVENDIAATMKSFGFNSASVSPSRCWTGCAKPRGLPDISASSRYRANKPAGWLCRPALPPALTSY